VPYRVYFYRTARGSREVRAFLRKLPTKHAKKCIDYLKRIRTHGSNCHETYSPTSSKICGKLVRNTAASNTGSSCSFMRTSALG